MCGRTLINANPKKIRQRDQSRTTL